MTIQYEKAKNEAVFFSEIGEKEHFYRGDILYMKIPRKNLKEHGINRVNVISVINGTLEQFDNTALVFRAVRTIAKE